MEDGEAPVPSFYQIEAPADLCGRISFSAASRTRPVTVTQIQRGALLLLPQKVA